MQETILTLMIPAMTLIFSAIFVALWWQDRARVYILAYATWFLVVAAGLLAQALFVTAFGAPQILLFHFSSSFGLIALLWGIARRDDRKVPLGFFLLVTSLTAIIVWYAATLGNSAVLIMAQNFNAGLLFTLGAYGKWSAGQRHWADRCLLAALVALSLYSVFRPSVTVLIRSQMTMEEYHTSVLLTVNMVMTAVLCMIISISLLATILADNMSKERKAAKLDPLSGLANRAAFEQHAEQMVARATEEGKAFSLIVGDIDHFKQVNDRFGHAAGDRAIAAFGDLISGKIRDTDIGGRIGGEEFCILVWNCEAGPAAGLANRIRLAADQGGARGDDAIPSYTASFGVAEAREGESYTQLFERADAALYEAKNGGRNRVYIDGLGAFGASSDGPEAEDAHAQSQKAQSEKASPENDRVIDFIGRSRFAG